jgi:hypothetical protein
MIFRTFHEETMYIIEAPAGSKLVVEEGRSEELVVFDEMPGGMLVERRLPHSVVVNAARRGCCGLSIRQERSPWTHPEAAPCAPRNDGAGILPRPGSPSAPTRRLRLR